jgi:hypothetical protein
VAGAGAGCAAGLLHVEVPRRPFPAGPAEAVGAEAAGAAGTDGLVGALGAVGVAAGAAACAPDCARDGGVRRLPRDGCAGLPSGGGTARGVCRHVGNVGSSASRRQL